MYICQNQSVVTFKGHTNLHTHAHTLLLLRITDRNIKGTGHMYNELHTLVCKSSTTHTVSRPPYGSEGAASTEHCCQGAAKGTEEKTRMSKKRLQVPLNLPECCILEEVT